MGKASKERRRLQRMAKLQGQELSSFSDLASYGRDKVTTALQAAHRATVAPIQESFREPFSAVSSQFHGKTSMSTSRLKSLASTVFQGKGATAMSRSRSKRPVLGLMVLVLTAVAGYWGYNQFGRSDARDALPNYQYHVERQAPKAEENLKSNSIFSVAKVGEVFNLKKANPNIKHVSAKQVHSSKSSKLHKKHGHHKAKRHHAKLAKKHSKGGIQKASFKKHGSHKNGSLKKKKHHK